MRVTEIYKSIQGESSWSGLPCVFIRLTGCNLRCIWCDSAYSFSGGVELTLEQLLARVEQLDCKLITLTGGEPLLQNETPILAQQLLAAGCVVLVETSGERSIEVLPEGAICILDLKCPDSGMSAHNRFENIALLKPRDEVKFVLASRRDYEWARDQIRAHKLHERVNASLLSVVFGKLKPLSVVEWMLADNLPARFQLQMHKFIWPPETRGV